MLAAQSAYGHNPTIVTEGPISIGRALFPTLPEDRFDRGPQQLGAYLFAGDVRLDNRDDLAAALAIEPHELKQLCDSALALRAFARWGAQAVTRFVGEFALALWDGDQQILLLARDFLGMRPLYYCAQDGFFAFASMPSGLHALPGIARDVDYAFMAEQLALVPQWDDNCFFRGLRRVQSGHVVRVTRAGVQSSSYWSPPAPRRLPSRDCEDGLRDVLETAVRAQLRGLNDDVATHLSSGLDSTIVTATAARLNAPHKIVAFTAAPRRDFTGPVPSGTLADERELAALVAKLHPNVEQIVVETDAAPLAGMAEECAYVQEPPVNLCNGVWIHGIFRAARERGLTTLLMGAIGNISISYTGADLLPWLLGRGRLIRLATLGGQLIGNGLAPRTVLAQAFGPYMPAMLWRALLRMRGRSTDLPTYSAVNLRWLPELEQRAKERGLDFLFRPRRDPLESRLWMLRRYDGGNSIKSALARWGISVRDPTGDQRVVEYCLSLPYGEFIRGGQYRSLARRGFRDRVPDQILHSPLRGYQGADWYEGLAHDLPAIGELIEAIDGTPAADVLDLDWMRNTVTTWPQDGWQRGDVMMRYRAGLLRAVSAAHFMRTVQDGA